MPVHEHRVRGDKNGGRTLNGCGKEERKTNKQTKPKQQ